MLNWKPSWMYKIKSSRKLDLKSSRDMEEETMWSNHNIMLSVVENVLEKRRKDILFLGWLLGRGRKRNCTSREQNIEDGKTDEKKTDLSISELLMKNSVGFIHYTMWTNILRDKALSKNIILQISIICYSIKSLRLIV